MKTTQNLLRIKFAISEKPRSAIELVEMFPEMNKSVIYRTIKRLLDNNQISEVRLPDGQLAYERLEDNHPHLICEQCNKISCVDLPEYIMIALNHFESKMKERGFSNLSAKLDYFYICKSCQR